MCVGRASIAQLKYVQTNPSRKGEAWIDTKIAGGWRHERPPQETSRGGDVVGARIYLEPAALAGSWAGKVGAVTGRFGTQETPIRRSTSMTPVAPVTCSPACASRRSCSRTQRLRQPEWVRPGSSSAMLRHAGPCSSTARSMTSSSSSVHLRGAAGALHTHAPQGARSEGCTGGGGWVGPQVSVMARPNRPREVCGTV